MSEFTRPVDTDRPAVLLDIDGVLLVDSKSKPKSFKPHPPARWLAYSLQHLLPDFSWVNTNPYGGIDPASRARAIEDLFPDRPVAWADDDLGFEEFSWAIERDLDSAPTILLRPDYDTGLRLEHMQRVQQWLGHVSAASA